MKALIAALAIRAVSASPRPSTLASLFHRPEVRRISARDLDWALAEGWKDFLETRGDVVLLAVIYPLVGFFAAAISFNVRLLPLLFPLIAGISILGPAVALGFYEIGRRREAGLEASWRHGFDGLWRRGRPGLFLLILGLVALFVAWMSVAAAIYGLTVQPDHPASAAAFVRIVFTTAEGWRLIAFGNLAGLTFAASTLLLMGVAFPMAVDTPVSATLAVMTSVAAVAKNPMEMATWGVRVAALLALGCLPMFIGLAIVLPVLGFATWKLYTRLVQR
ncbi:MAG: hypothetical protein JWO83_4646 [Caulobacteraceae bacterium]|nr:hypothetical protein [Caulobacteraceae bacterium]